MMASQKCLKMFLIILLAAFAAPAPQGTTKNTAIGEQDKSARGPPIGQTDSINPVPDIDQSLPAKAHTGPKNFNKANLSPGGKKAGIAGVDAVPLLGDAIGWYYDWSVSPPEVHSSDAIPVAMVWGEKSLPEFLALDETPEYVLGFNEPDCAIDGVAADMAVDESVEVWDDVVLPKVEEIEIESNNPTRKRTAAGTDVKVGSPALCGVVWNWLDLFVEKTGVEWDFTAVHIYHDDMNVVKHFLDTFAKYGKPIWVTEFACVETADGWKGCEDRDKINQFVRDAVDLFESDPRVAAYAPVTGGNLLPKDKWDFVAGQELTETGRVYLEAIQGYA